MLFFKAEFLTWKRCWETNIHFHLDKTKPHWNISRLFQMTEKKLKKKKKEQFAIDGRLFLSLRVSFYPCSKTVTHVIHNMAAEMALCRNTAFFTLFGISRKKNHFQQKTKHVWMQRPQPCCQSGMKIFWCSEQQRGGLFQSFHDPMMQLPAPESTWAQQDWGVENCHQASLG